MNIKILTCLLVVVAYSEAGNVPVFKDTIRPPTSRNLPDEDTQHKIIAQIGDDLVPFIIDGVHHFHAKHHGLDVPEKTSPFTEEMLSALENPKQYHEVDSGNEGAVENLSAELQTLGTSRVLLYLGFLYRVLSPIIKDLSTTIFGKASRSLPEVGSDGLSEEDVMRLFNDFETARAIEPEEHTLHKNILGFLFKTVVPGIINVAEKILLGETPSFRRSISADTLSKEAWNYINREVIPAYATAVKQIHAENEGGDLPASRYIPDESTQIEDEDIPEYIKNLFSDMDNDNSSAGLYDEHGRRGDWWQDIVDWFTRNLVVPLVILLHGGGDKDKELAIQNTKLKIELDRIKAEEERTHAITDQEKKKLNAQIESLNNQMEVLKLDAAKNEEEKKKQQENMETMSKEEVAKAKIQVLGKVQKELNGIIEKEKAGRANTTP